MGVLLGALLVFLGACTDDAQFTVKYAPGYPKPGATVSVLGVFKDGRMSQEAWDDVTGKVSPALGAASCPVGYDARLTTTNRQLAEAIDESARANGVTDDLLDQLTPAASGDLILILTVAGRPPGHTGLTSSAPTSAPTSPGRNGRRGSTMGGGMSRAPIDRNAFEISGSLFSVKEHRSVALVHMGYIGASGADALAKFSEKLHESLAGSSCSGWHWDAKIDDERIRQIKEE